MKFVQKCDKTEESILNSNHCCRNMSVNGRDVTGSIIATVSDQRPPVVCAVRRETRNTDQQGCVAVSEPFSAQRRAADQQHTEQAQRYGKPHSYELRPHTSDTYSYSNFHSANLYDSILVCTRSCNVCWSRQGSMWLRWHEELSWHLAETSSWLRWVSKQIAIVIVTSRTTHPTFP